MPVRELLIAPKSGWQPLDIDELLRHRDVLTALVSRDIRIRYRQTLLGGLWALLQPLLAMLIFAQLFGRLGFDRGLEVPYALFAFAGLLPWTFFANSVSMASNSLVGNQQFISKVYFPRVFVPLGAIGALLLDFAIGVLVALAMLAYYHITPGPQILLLPIFMLGCVVVASGVGFLLSALNVQFRDVKYIVPFAVQMGLFLSPVIYPVSGVSPAMQFLLAINPMTGMIEGFRYALLKTPPAGWQMATSTAVGVVLFVLGLYVFRRMERRFADVI
jgi:lipopolysaccharide transport system permease protein